MRQCVNEDQSLNVQHHLHFPPVQILITLWSALDHIHQLEKQVYYKTKHFFLQFSLCSRFDFFFVRTFLFFLLFGKKSLNATLNHNFAIKFRNKIAQNKQS